jgi:hypothetical protein
MSNSYPHLGPVENKTSSESGYQYIEPPKHDDKNPDSLNDPLLQDPQPSSNDYPNKTSDRIIGFSLIPHIVIFYLVFKVLPIFEFCFWDFGLTKYSQSEYMPDVPVQGSLGNFYSRLGCASQDYSRCPGTCELVLNFEDSWMWFCFSLSISCFITAAGLIWINSLSRAKNFAKARKIFIVFQSIAAICLIFGVTKILYGVGSQDLAKPADLGDGVSPEDFEWKLGFYLMIFMPVWNVVASVIAYLKMK